MNGESAGGHCSLPRKNHRVAPLSCAVGVAMADPISSPQRPIARVKPVCAWCDELVHSCETFEHLHFCAALTMSCEQITRRSTHTRMAPDPPTNLEIREELESAMSTGWGPNTCAEGGAGETGLLG